MRIPVAIEDNGAVVGDDDMENQDADVDDEDEREDVQHPTFRGGPDKLHVSRKAIAKYGATEGCAACTAIKRLGHRKGKLNHNHNEECRQRIIRLMTEDPEYRKLMDKHGYLEKQEQSIEMVSEVQCEETMGHIRKAIHHINNVGGYHQSNIEKGLDRAMMELLIANIQVAEVYSPPPGL